MPHVISVNAATGLQAELFEPLGASNGAAVVIAYGSEGMTNHLSGPWGTMVHEFAEELVAKGITVVIPNYLVVTGTPPAPDVWFLIGRHGGTWQGSIADAMTYAQTLPDITAARIGLLGFSLGGHLCLRLRETTPALVSFYAPAAGLQPYGGRLVLDVQLHQGDDDLLVGEADARAIEGMLRREAAQVEPHLYPGANHGFTGDDPQNTAARQASLERTVAFFEQRL
jgi:carboxymethylenebutenolidase